MEDVGGVMFLAAIFEDGTHTVQKETCKAPVNGK
jgi:hypothetical protein